MARAATAPLLSLSEDCAVGLEGGGGGDGGDGGGGEDGGGGDSSGMPLKNILAKNGLISKQLLSLRTPQPVPCSESEISGRCVGDQP